MCRSGTDPNGDARHRAVRPFFVLATGGRLLFSDGRLGIVGPLIRRSSANALLLTWYTTSRNDGHRLYLSPLTWSLPYKLELPGEASASFLRL